MAKTFFITTAIDYTNSAPHIGHAYEKILADVIARYHRLRGEDVFFLTGVDQHGQKVQRSAAKAGVQPAEFVKEITQKFIDLWKKLDVQYDEWAETISDRHKKVVQGILQLPFDKDFVTYVWFDALTNYISFADYDPSKSNIEHQSSSFLDKWPALQDIGKDVLVPAHGIYWLIMLHAIGFPDNQMPQLLVHGWWNLGGAKMSKSAGNIVDPFVLADKYGAKALRYYLMSDIATGQDADFSEERLVERYNSDLANNLGNLLNRTLNMVQRYCEGRLRKPRESRKLPTDVIDGYKQLVDHYRAATMAVRPDVLIKHCLY